MISITEILQMGPVMPVIVIDDSAQAVPLAQALLQGGVVAVRSQRDRSVDDAQDFGKRHQRHVGVLPQLHQRPRGQEEPTCSSQRGLRASRATAN